MDMAKAMTFMFSTVVIIATVTMITGFTYSLMDVQGNPLTWRQWNGYKAAGAFKISAQGEFGSGNPKNYISEEVKVNTAARSPFTMYVCSSNLEGFRTEDEIVLVTYVESGNCIKPRSGINVTLNTGNGVSGVLVDGLPKSFERYRGIPVGGEQ